MPPLILASGSPRRAEILNAVGWDFVKDVTEVDESEIAGESPQDYVSRLAVEKARAVAVRRAGQLVLGADTTVVLNGAIIGKPVDVEDAKAMLRRLSGNEHEVLTGVALVRDNVFRTAVEHTSVRFDQLTEDDVQFLVDYGEPLDKAGAYAVQAQAALFIRGIVGDYWNVVGLPVNLVYRLAAEIQ
ncbi:MAG: septum formation inhibitor Maf [Blastocatellia bacterium]|nr:septum formation inhibitor Maf [Blastocatellia bacterium]